MEWKSTWTFVLFVLLVIVGLLTVNFVQSKVVFSPVATPVSNIGNPSPPNTFHILRDYPVDYDGNGLYDAIILEVRVYVNASGEYRLAGKLEEIGDQQQRIDSSYPINLTKGKITFVNLTYTWEEIYIEEIEGYLTLKEISLLSLTDYETFDEEFYSYNTTYYYNYSEFESPEEINFVLSDYGEDIDNNSLYDYLSIEMSNLSEGEYIISINLEDDFGNFFYPYDTPVVYYVDSSGIIKFNFRGYQLYFPKKYSQYHVPEIFILPSNDSIGRTYYDVHDTDYYNYSEFEDPGIEVLENFSDYGVDENNNSIYDYFSVGMDVNVTDPGYYRFQGYLDDPLNLPSHNLEPVYLGEGRQRVFMDFSGILINHFGIEGPYFLSWAGISGLGLNYFPNYTTSNYSYMDFESDPGLEVIGNLTDYGLDINNNSLYDYLVMEILVNVTLLGTYNVEGYISSLNLDFREDYFLSEENETLYIYFNGSEIYSAGLNQSYEVYSKITKYWYTVYQNYDYITNFYNYTEFEH